MKKKLNRSKQCAKCPWKKSTNPHDIPNGYNVDLHCNLKKTISDGGLNLGSSMNAFACHESDPGKETYCIGWLMNQLGPGNNIALRLKMMNYDLSEVKTDGDQHETFEETLPKGPAANKRSRSVHRKD
jgi:hypothetical protein